MPAAKPNLSGSLKLSGIAAYNPLLNKDMKTPLTLQQTGLALIHKKTRIEPAPGSRRITGTEKFQAHMSHLRSRLWRSPAASRGLGAGGIIAQISTGISGGFADRPWLLSVNDLFQPCSSASLMRADIAGHRRSPAQPLLESRSPFLFLRGREWRR